MVKESPRLIEYVCLLCGAQGSLHTETDVQDTQQSSGGFSVRCPKCGGYVLHLDRETASMSLLTALSR